MSDASSKLMSNKDSHKLGYGPLAAVLVTIGVYVLAQLAVSLLLVAGATLAGADDVGQFITDSVWIQFATAVLSAAAMMGLLAFFMRRRMVSWGRIGLVRPKTRDIGIGLVGFGVYLASVLVVMSVFATLVPGIDLDQQQEVGFVLSTTGPALILVFVSLVLVPPFIEEVLVRGFLYTGLRARLSFLPAALVTSLLFGLAHLQLNDGQSPLWTAVIDTFVLAMILAYLRERTGSLWPPIALHFMKNSLAFILLFVFRVA